MSSNAFYHAFPVWNLKGDSGASKAVMLAAMFFGISHLFLGIMGTFVLKRFPTSFSVGFFLGMLVILANQNMMLYVDRHIAWVNRKCD